MSNRNDLPPNDTPSYDSAKGSGAPRSSSLQVARRGNVHPEPGGSNPPISLRFVLNTMRQWWKVATPIGLVLATVAAGVVYLFFDPMYRASALLWIDDAKPYIAFPERDSSRRFINTQIELIRSSLVLGPVVGQPEIISLPELTDRRDPMEWLQAELDVDSLNESELFVVSLTVPDPANAAHIVNAIVDEYIALQSKDTVERVQRVATLLEEERLRRDSEVTSLRENVRTLTQDATGKDPYVPGSASEALQNYPITADLKNRLTNAEVERVVLEAEIKALEEVVFPAQVAVPEGEMVDSAQVAVPEGIVDRAVEERVEVQALVVPLAEKRARLKEYEMKLRESKNHPLYRELLAEIAGDEQKAEELRSELREEVKAEMGAAHLIRLKDTLTEMKLQLTSFQKKEEFLRERYESQLKEREQFSGDTLDLEFKRAELARAEEVLDLIKEREMKLSTEKWAPARVRLRRSATPPLAPVEWLPYKRMSLAALAALCFPFALAVVWERTVRRVSDSEQLERQSDLPVLGEIACLPVRTSVARGSVSRRFGESIGIFEESIDSLRTCLVLSDSLRDMRTLVVTSAANNEGKTSVALQLAVSIARASGQPTLLVDGDMRSPDIHSLLEIPLTPGLAEVLGGESTLEQAVVTSWSQYVHLLPAGKARSSPHKLLGNGILHPLMDELRVSYRYVIIDTPPVLAASEALVLARAADASLICAMRDVSRLDKVRRTHDRLVASSAHPIGIVLNGIPARRYTYRYGSYGYARSHRQ